MENKKEYVPRPWALDKKEVMEPRYHGLTFNDYKVVNEGQARALEVARRFVDLFREEKSNGEWLAMSGNRGTGKSMLANIIAGEVYGLGRKVIHLTGREIFSDYRDGRATGEDEWQFIDAAEKDLIVISEVGNTDLSKVERNFWREYVDTIYRKRRSLVIATNLDFTEEGIGQYIEIDRLTEQCEKEERMLFFDWPSHRSGLVLKGVPH